MFKRVCRVLMSALFGVFKSNLKLQLNFHQNLYQTTLLQCTVGLTSFWACFPLNLNCCTALCPAGPPELGLAQMNSCVLMKRQKKNGQQENKVLGSGLYFEDRPSDTLTNKRLYGVKI